MHGSYHKVVVFSSDSTNYIIWLYGVDTTNINVEREHDCQQEHIHTPPKTATSALNTDALKIEEAVGLHRNNNNQSINQASKQASKQTSQQTNKQTSKPTSK